MASSFGDWGRKATAALAVVGAVSVAPNHDLTAHTQFTSDFSSRASSLGVIARGSVPGAEARAQEYVTIAQDIDSRSIGPNSSYMQIRADVAATRTQGATAPSTAAPTQAAPGVLTRRSPGPGSSGPTGVA